MLAKDQWMEIHVLKAQGLSLRQIAKQLGVSRNTVTRYLASEDVPRYKQREPRSTKLEPFHGYILERMAAAAPEWISAPAMLRELKARGYEGQLRSVQAFMQMNKPSAPHDPVVRFETAPGQQMQCDFVVFRRGRDPLYAFTATLGYSRWRWVRFATNERAETLIACHHALFETLQGVPREILYDNAKTIVDKRDAFGEGYHAGIQGSSTSRSATASCHACVGPTVPEPRARSNASTGICAATSTCPCPAPSSKPAWFWMWERPTSKWASGCAMLPTSAFIP